jgi:hypothetical protein
MPIEHHDTLSQDWKAGISAGRSLRPCSIIFRSSVVIDKKLGVHIRSRFVNLKLRFARSTAFPLKPSNARLSDDSVEALLEPLHGLLALDAVLRANTALHAPASGNTLARSGHAAVKVHTVDTDRRVVLDTEINVLANTEAKVASLAEVTAAKFVFLDLEATLENFLGLSQN